MSEINCAVCGATGVEEGQACPSCRSSPQWQDLFQASVVAAEQCLLLHNRGLLSIAELQRVNDDLRALRAQWTEKATQGERPPIDSGLASPVHCRQCHQPANRTQNFCAKCGEPTGARADRLRHLDFTINLIKHRITGEISADNAERCVEAIREHSKTTEAELKSEPALSAPARRNLIEILLDPQSIRWLLVSGGVLLTVGLVIFLSSLGVFRNPIVVASAMGAGTLAMLAGGIAMIRCTRHSLAGRAMALLGCLVMPLNLWFYNANHLVTLDGYLWVAAMVCCVLYAASAYLLEDPMFIYVLFGGVTMTGLLVLADLHRLIEFSAPATMLVVLGLISLHAERAFADDDGPFSRKRFGQACFRSAHAMIGLGLLLILGSQIGVVVGNLGLGLYHQLSAQSSDQWLALGLILAGAYGYAYSSLVVRRGGVYGHFAVICLLWAELLGIHIAHLTTHLTTIISVMALTSLAMNVAGRVFSRNDGNQRKPTPGPLAPLAIGLITFSVAMGLIPHLRTFLRSLPEHFDLSITWTYVVAMAITVVSARIAAALQARHHTRLTVAYHLAASTATFVAAASLLTLIGISTWLVQAPVLMAIPIVYLVASRLHKDGTTKHALPTIAVAAATVLLFGCLIAGNAQWMSPIAGQTTDLWLAGFALESAAFFAIAAATRGNKLSVYASSVTFVGAIYQLAGYLGCSVQSCNTAIAMSGVLGLIGLRIVNAGRGSDRGRTDALSICANGLISLPTTGMLLLSLSQLADGRMQLSMLWPVATLSALALVAAIISKGGARRWYFALTISQVAMSLLTLAEYSTLSMPRKMEMFSVSVGLLLLVIGYGIWYRTQDGRSGGMGACLFIGALMAGLPPAIFAVVNRFGFEISFVDELVLMTIALSMFLTGMMTRVRATTLIGGGLLVCHLVTLVVFAGMKAQLAVGVYVCIGGAVLFAVGVGLSVYRDRLLTMPLRIKERQGLFRVLAWT